MVAGVSAQRLKPQPEYPTTTPSGRPSFYIVQAMVGDYIPEGQPRWGAEWPTFQSAVEEADRRWHWLLGYSITHESTLMRVGTSEICVFVFRADDETGDDPEYVRGNPNCAEG